MSKIKYVARETRGINHILLTPAAQPLGVRLSRVDRILIAIVLASYVALVICVVK